MTTNLATLAEVKVHLGETSTKHDAILQDRLNAAAAMLGAWCGRPFDTTARVERVRGDGGVILYLPYPLQTGETLTLEYRDDPSAAWVALGASTFETFGTFDPVSTAVQRIDGELFEPSRWPNYQLSWNTGYTVAAGAAPAPEEIRSSVLDIAVALFRGRRGTQDSDALQISEQVSAFVGEVVKRYTTQRLARPANIDLFKMRGRSRLYDLA